jgi:hypothetical protein
VLGTLSNREKSDWISLAKSPAKLAPAYSARDCPVTKLVPQRTGHSRENSAHHGYNSPDCPLCTGLFGDPAAPTTTVARAINGRHVDFANGHQVAPDYLVCHRAGGCNSRVRQKRKEIVHCSLSGGAPDSHEQKATKAFQMEFKRLLAALRL